MNLESTSFRGRHMRRAWYASALIGCALCFLLGVGHVEPANAVSPEPAVDSTPASGNVYRSGGRVFIGEPIAGDLIAAGGRVVVDRPVSRDAMVAGGDVAIRATVGEDLRATGGLVTVDAAIEGEAYMAGGRILIGRAGRIASRAWIAGGDVEVLGRLPDKSRIYAGHAAIDGEVDGDLLAQADTIELRPGARIKGTLTYSSAHALVRDPAAQVLGGVVQEPWSEAGRVTGQAGSGWAGAVLSLLGLVAAVAVWTLLFPEMAENAKARLFKAPGISLAFGAAVLLIAPMAMLLLLITLIGAPLALVLMAAYGLLLLAGYLVSASALGDRLLRVVDRGTQATRARRLLASALAVVLLGLLAMLPMLGGLITVVVLMAGTGALVNRFPRSMGFTAPGIGDPPVIP